MTNKKLSVEDVIRQMNDMFTDPNATAKPPSKILINPAQMAVIRQMMDAGALTNHPPSKREVYEKEIVDEVPQVQPSNNSK